MERGVQIGVVRDSTQVCILKRRRSGIFMTLKKVRNDLIQIAQE